MARLSSEALQTQYKTDGLLLPTGIVEHSTPLQKTRNPSGTTMPRVQESTGLWSASSYSIPISKNRKPRWTKAPWWARSSSWTTSKCSREYFTNAQLKHPGGNAEHFGRQPMWKSLYKIKWDPLWQSLVSSSIMQQREETAGYFS